MEGGWEEIELHWGGGSEKYVKKNTIETAKKNKRKKTRKKKKRQLRRLIKSS